MIRLITFDLDDTLWPCAPVIRRAEALLYRWLQGHAPRLTAAMGPEDLVAHRNAFMRAHPELGHDLTRLRLYELETLLARFGYPRRLALVATAVFRAARNRVEPWPEVIGVLQRLRKDYRLVSVTNGNAQVAHTPLAGLFHLDLTAAQVGYAKPHPALFQAAARWGGVRPEQILHVGDDPERDVLAARRAGLQAVWLRREPASEWPVGSPPPDHVLNDLCSLPALLEGALATPSEKV